jgi:hypothetical protein
MIIQFRLIWESISFIILSSYQTLLIYVPPRNHTYQNHTDISLMCPIADVSVPPIVALFSAIHMSHVGHVFSLLGNQSHFVTAR